MSRSEELLGLGHGSPPPPEGRHVRGHGDAVDRDGLPNSREQVGEMISIDRLDAEILGQLDTNARKGVAELAADLGVSRNTVQLRMKKLEEAGVLLGFRPEVDLAAMGITVQAFVSLELDQRRLLEVVEGLARIPEVLEVRTQAGREDLVVHVASTSLQDIQRIAGATNPAPARARDPGQGLWAFDPAALVGPLTSGRHQPETN